jgi:hypothetical protein
MSGEATRRQPDNQKQDDTDQRFPGRQDEGRQPNPEKDRNNPNQTDPDRNRQNNPGQDKNNSEKDNAPRR